MRTWVDLYISEANWASSSGSWFSNGQRKYAHTKTKELTSSGSIESSAHVHVSSRTPNLIQVSGEKGMRARQGKKVIIMILFFYFVCIIFYSLLQADEICMWCTVKMLCVYTVAIGEVHRCMHRDSSHSVATNGNEALNPGITTNRISCNKFIMNFAIRFPFEILKMYRGGLLLFSSISLLKSVRCECVVVNKEQQPSTIFKDARATAIPLLFSILLRI